MAGCSSEREARCHRRRERLLGGSGPARPTVEAPIGAFRVSILVTSASIPRPGERTATLARHAPRRRRQAGVVDARGRSQAPPPGAPLAPGLRARRPAADGHAGVRRLERGDRAGPGRARARRAAERRAEPAGRICGRAGPARRRLAAGAGLGRWPRRAGAADGGRRAAAHELPERARHARGAARVGRRPDRQRERLHRHGRDHVRRQRRARGAGRAAAACAPARAADRR